MLAIPGIGPFIAAGPLVAALAGVGVGGAVGGIAGALIGMGIPEYEAKRYEGESERRRDSTFGALREFGDEVACERHSGTHGCVSRFLRRPKPLPTSRGTRTYRKLGRQVGVLNWRCKYCEKSGSGPRTYEGDIGDRTGSTNYRGGLFYCPVPARIASRITARRCSCRCNYKARRESTGRGERVTRGSWSGNHDRRTRKVLA